MSPLQTNRDRLIEQSVLGEVSPPRARKGRHWRVGPDGVPWVLPGVGGITYNCKVGHSALDWEADHVEPGVSVRAEKEEANPFTVFSILLLSYQPISLLLLHLLRR